MKKRITALFLAAAVLTGIISSGQVYADNRTLSASGTITLAAAVSDETAQPVSETEAQAQILPTDRVSTEDIALFSKACCVMDAESGQVLYYKNPSERHYPASITKVLTALLLIENSNLQDELPFTEECWMDIDRWEDMNVAMEPGESLTAEQALYCMLLVSANEVCNQAAIAVSGSVEAFADLMNSRARELGATGSHFVTTNGLHDEDHYTTAYDMALISRAAILNDTFRQVTGTLFYNVVTDLRPEGFELYHKHRMLATTKYYDERCIGGKTGYTPQANNTLVTYMEDNGITLVIVVMDNNNGHIYSDTKLAADYCFDHYNRAKIDELSMTGKGEEMNAAGITLSKADDIESSETSGPEQSGDFTKTTAPTGESLHLMDGTGSSQQTGDPSLEESAGGLKRKVVNAIIQNVPYSFGVLIALFLAFTLLLIWFRGFLHRKIHRRRYKKLRRQDEETKTTP